LTTFHTRLRGPRSRYKSRASVEEAATQILSEIGAQRWVRFALSEHLEPIYRQEKRGRPGSITRYVRRYRTRFDITWETDLCNIQ
jgi:hypothetical protein